jgi:hypothetical protein
MESWDMSSVESSSVKPTDVEREVRESLIKNDSDNTNAIPSWNDLSTIYESRWNKDKEKFQKELRANFFNLVERFASGKQELFMLSVSGQREKLYIRAFLELFESGYAPHVGDAERVAGRRVKRLFVTLPHNYHD